MTADVERRCRACGGPLRPSQPPHHHTCTACFWLGRRRRPAVTAPGPRAELASIPGQMTFDAIEPEPDRPRERVA
jgi:hypothetical protein